MCGWSRWKVALSSQPYRNFKEWSQKYRSSYWNVKLIVILQLWRIIHGRCFVLDIHQTKIYIRSDVFSYSSNEKAPIAPWIAGIDITLRHPRPAGHSINALAVCPRDPPFVVKVKPPLHSVCCFNLRENMNWYFVKLPQILDTVSSLNDARELVKSISTVSDSQMEIVEDLDELEESFTNEQLISNQYVVFFKPLANPVCETMTWYHFLKASLSMDGVQFQDWSVSCFISKTYPHWPVGDTFKSCSARSCQKIAICSACSFISLKIQIVHYHSHSHLLQRSEMLTRITTRRAKEGSGRCLSQRQENCFKVRCHLCCWVGIPITILRMVKLALSLRIGCMCMVS